MTLRWIVTLGVAAVVAVAAVIVIRAVLLGPEMVYVDAPAPFSFDEEGAPERLAGAIRIRTATRGDSPADLWELAELHRHLEASFPRVHAEIRREAVNGGSLLYTWPGRDPNAEPVLLTAHLDVVPAEEGSGGRWIHPPFGGVVDDGFVWGRGALDDKASVMAILEAIEALLGAGYGPERTVLVAFGHDEEVGGRTGAARIAGLIDQRGSHPTLVLDEGLSIVDGIVPGLDRPAAMVGLAEKGFLSVELIARGAGGHSSMPPPDPAVAILARAIARLSDRPMPGRMAGPVAESFEALAPHMGFASRVVFANQWLFGPLIRSRLAASPGTNALFRTTTAPTMLQGSVKQNVLPIEARAVVNFRIHPSDSVGGVFAHVESAVGDPRVEVRRFGGVAGEPGPVSPSSGPAYDAIARTIRQIYPEVVVAPSLSIGTTDARHYNRISEAVYRFVPIVLGPDDLARFHGVDERIAIDDYMRMVRFYAQLIRNAAGRQGMGTS